MQRFLTVNNPHDLADMRTFISRFRVHYNRRRPHQSRNQSTPEIAGRTLAHTPATQPLQLSVLQAKASEYRQAQQFTFDKLGTAKTMVTKSGELVKGNSLEQRAP